MKEPKYCPICQEELRELSGRSYHCKKCKIVMQILVEIISVGSPVLSEV